MMRKFGPALVGILSFAAGYPVDAQQTPPEAYLDSVDRQIAENGKGIPGRPYPCAVEKVEEGFTAIESAPTDQCVKMQPAKEWRGLWRNDFEGSQFCTGPASTCEFDSAEGRVWLTPGPMRGELGAVYEIVFLGRRTAFKGAYGHMGLSDFEIIVDRPISVKMIQAPLPELSQAEADAEWKRCEKAGNCISTKKLMQEQNDNK
jgi:hypothetical protein